MSRRSQSSHRPAARRPRVALVAHGVHVRGGMERACTELILRTSDRFEYVVVATELEEGLESLVGGWVRVRVPRRPFPVRFISFYLVAGLKLRHVRVDLIHTVGAIVPNRVDLAAVHFCHAGYRASTARLTPPGAPMLRRVNTAITRLLALAAEHWSYRPRRLRRLAAVSDGVAAEVAEHFPDVPVTVTPNGVDLERYHPDRVERQRTRQEIGVAPGKAVALFVGGDWDRKGLALAIEGVALARRAGARLELWVVGAGDTNRFAAFAAQFGLGDLVRFFGTRSDVEHFYQAADVFVLPSEYETFSIACFEAAASGLPLVIPPLYGACELVRAGGGVLVERNPSSISTALVRFVADPQLRRSAADAARIAASAYTWDRSSVSVVHQYEALLSHIGH